MKVFGGRPAPSSQGPHLVGVVGKVDLVEYLRGFVLDGLHLHQVWGVLPGPVSESRGAGGYRQGQLVHGARSGGNL